MAANGRDSRERRTCPKMPKSSQLMCVEGRACRLVGKISLAADNSGHFRTRNLRPVASLARMRICGFIRILANAATICECSHRFKNDGDGSSAFWRMQLRFANAATNCECGYGLSCASGKVWGWGLH
jgi:hypothetical protein